MIPTTTRIRVEIWASEEQRLALIREAHRSCTDGGLETFAAVVLNSLAEKLASPDTAERKAGFDALRLLGVHKPE